MKWHRGSSPRSQKPCPQRCETTASQRRARLVPAACPTAGLSLFLIPVLPESQSLGQSQATHFRQADGWDWLPAVPHASGCLEADAKRVMSLGPWRDVASLCPLQGLCGAILCSCLIQFCFGGDVRTEMCPIYLRKVYLENLPLLPPAPPGEPSPWL